MKAITAFIAIAYALAIALSLFIGLSGGAQSRFIGWAYISMLLPAVAVWLVYVLTKEGPRVCWHCLPLRYLPIGLFLIPGLLHAVMLPLMASLGGGLHWQDWLTPQADGLYHTPASRGWGAVTTPSLIGHIVLNAIVGLAIISVLAFFEEIGWRAWLLPRLKDHIGARWAVVATAIIWALWHVPFELSGILRIQGVPPVKLAVTVAFGTTAAGLILGWLWLRTESIWLVSLAHGALNNWGQYAFKYLKQSVSSDRELVVLAAGSSAVLAAGILLLWRGVPNPLRRTD